MSLLRGKAYANVDTIQSRSIAVDSRRQSLLYNRDQWLIDWAADSLLACAELGVSIHNCLWGKCVLRLQ